MKALRQLLWTALAFGSWALALYLFYLGSAAAGLGALLSSVMFGFVLASGKAIADQLGPNTIKTIKKEAFEEGRRQGRREAL